MSTNVFARAKTLRKSNPNKTWQQLISMASKKGNKVVSSPKTNNMATTKRRSTPRKKPTARRKSVSGVRTVTVRKTTKRRSVGAIVDKTTMQMIIGMALTGVVQGAIAPLRSRIPAKFQKLADPALVVLGGLGAQKFKNPIVKGICLGIMADGVKNTTQLVMGMMGQQQPVVIPPAPAPGGGGYNPINSMGDFYIPLPSMNGVGSIPQMLAGGENVLATLPNIGNSADTPYLPLGWDA